METEVSEFEGQVCCSETWEEAYLRFETVEEEREKFIKRLKKMGIDQWSKDIKIAEVFCGRGNGILALKDLGFSNIVGMDLSPSLLDECDKDLEILVCDARQIPQESEEYDAAIIHGGLHHLPTLPEDLEQCLSEIRRILKPQGHFCCVEPWKTPFLDFVHFVSERKLARKMWGKLDAFAVMTEHESETYFNWLSRPQEILGLYEANFQKKYLDISYGKINYIGQKKA